MSRLRNMASHALISIGPRFLPFADAASEDLPLSRLLRLSLFQVSVGMALVLLVGTLNRVMIVELDVPASLVAIMISLPLLFAPFRALIGFKSDTHVSALGWRRVPYIWKGTLLQWGGFAIMPFALLVLSGKDYAEGTPEWIGQASAGIAFLLVGAGVHTIQTVGLALATDLAPREDQPKVVGLMYVMMLVGMIISALLFGWLLDPYYPAQLIKVIQGAAVATLVLNVIALWKQEARDRSRTVKRDDTPEFSDCWREFIRRPYALRGLIVIGLGTMGFGMADVLLEPYGGQVLGMTVSATTKLTAIFAGGGLVGFAWASRVLSRGYDPLRMAAWGAAFGVPGFAAVIAAAPLGMTPLFLLGTLIVGFGGGLFGHGTLTATMRLAPREQVGLALGAWGAVQATSAGVAVAAGGIVRDVILSLPEGHIYGEATPYLAAYVIEVAFLIAGLLVMAPLVRNKTLAAERV
ncbi:PucC family protein [Phaeovulum vinaykumarii]|uniref:MFS transporter, BCD family, chlorophyll transporter n=1 Tax=Phaeovulum vinaykumarii TaxID=407234 RepID=A0A1N7M430_9RHOB|nr:PucC family protein [Phaeovulum vinaykumarii]SIS80827.1 MFS transporter, BCD family, chlorophyll transporter [Phaeovulum vinaykumarii]SOC08911.1 BCD family chlorophyll transporter-like MFS transporter [Phaeovulum vinaykumarii]